MLINNSEIAPITPSQSNRRKRRGTTDKQAKIVTNLACPSCRDKGKDSSGNHMMVFDTGKGYCDRCPKFFTVEEVQAVKDGNGSNRKRTYGSSRFQKSYQKELTLEDIQYFGFLGEKHRVIKPDTDKHFGIRTRINESNAQPLSRYYPYYSEGDLYGCKVRDLPKTFSPAIGTIKGTDLFGWHLCTGVKKTLIIVEGEEDCAAAWQMNKAMNARSDNRRIKRMNPHVVSLPNGTKGAQQSLLHHIEDLMKYDKIIWMGDNYKIDPEGALALEVAVQVIGVNKLFVAEYPDRKKDPCDILKLGTTESVDCFAEMYFNAKKYSPADVKEGSEYTWDSVFKKPIIGHDIPFKTLNEKIGGFRLREHTVLLAPSGAGKCLGKDTKILMYDGSQKVIQDITQGELVMGDDSTPRKVLGTTIGSSEMFKVKTTKGEEHTVNRDHVLAISISGEDAVYDADGVKHSRYKRSTISVDTYLRSGKTFKEVSKLYKVSVDFKKDYELPIPPYILGIWLGDGSSSEPIIYTPNKSIKDEWIAYGETLNMKAIIRQDSGCECIRLSRNDPSQYMVGRVHTNPIKEKLKDLNLIGNKHIPEIYKLASKEDRLQLLAGILDTDGSLSSGGFDLTLKQLSFSKDVEFVARSLGLSSQVRESIRTIKSIGFTGTYYRQQICGNCDEIPTRVKIAPDRKQVKDHLVHGFTVESIGIDNYYGFELDGNHLFVMGDFFVSHNSTICRLIAHHLAKHENWKIGSIYLEEQDTKTVQGYIAAHLGIALNILRKNPEKVDEEDRLLAMKHISENHMFLTHSGSISPDVLMNKVRYMYNMGCKLIVFDHLTMAVNMESDQRLALDLLMEELYKFADNHDIHILSVIHLNRDSKVNFSKGAEITENNIRGSAGVLQQTWQAIAIECNLQHETLSNARFFRILKCREIGDLGLCDGGYLYDEETGKLEFDSSLSKEMIIEQKQDWSSSNKPTMGGNHDNKAV